MPKGKWKFKQQHHADIWRAMQRILETERWDSTLSDTKLAEAIMDEGVYCTHIIARDIRIAHKVGNGEERKVQLFAKQHKARK